MSPNVKVILTVAAAALCFGLAQADIKATAIVFRHGQRTNEYPVPGLQCDIVDELGTGQLTNVNTYRLKFSSVLTLILPNSDWQSPIV